ncbi:MAG: ROK family protein [Gemmatimonadales bacterium]
MRVLVIDIGGSHVKVATNFGTEHRSVESGPDLTPDEMVAAVKELTADWPRDAIAIGFPGPVAKNTPTAEPKHLGPGWVNFDFAGAFGLPVKVVNDALMQAIGSYEGGRMLFLGLGTGLGSALVLDNHGFPLELAHLPYRRRKSFEDCLGDAGRKRMGKAKWRRRVADVVGRLMAATLVDYVVLGGGNVEHVTELPEGARRGDNDNAFVGGYRLWDIGGIDA